MAAPMRMVCQKVLRHYIRLHANKEANKQVPCLCSFYCTQENVPIIHEGSKQPAKRGGRAEQISKAMKAYLERAKQYDELIETETAEYELGKRHLANIMGEDPDTFTQKDVNKAIAYLLPSGLYVKEARPLMKHPLEILPKHPAAAFGMSGRPHHYLFYTAKPHFYELMHDMAVKLENLIVKETKLRLSKKLEDKKELNISNSEWLSKDDLSELINEDITTQNHNQFKGLASAICDQYLASTEEEFIMQYRKNFPEQTSIRYLKKEILEDEEGRQFQWVKAKRKTAEASVKVWINGTGKISINGQDLLYFKDIMYREQIMFPIQFTGKLGEIDIEATVKGGGVSSQSGAIRFGIAKALSFFVNEEMFEKMNIAGLLTQDPRRRERKKPGQKGARAKFTWVKR